jgi:hypothetical protein
VTPPRLATVVVPLDPKNPKSAVSFANSNVEVVIVVVLTPLVAVLLKDVVIAMKII